MLNEFEDTAREAGWLTTSESSSPGLLDRLLHEHISLLIEEYCHPSGFLTSAGATIGPVGVSAAWSRGPGASPALRPQLNRLLDVLAERDGGLAITVDEVQDADLEELRRLGEIVQFARREGRPLAFAAAGLPTGIDDLLRSPGTTFLRRAVVLRLTDLSAEQTLDALSMPARDSGLPFTQTALHLAQQISQGYPYLIQALGFAAWASAQEEGAEVIGVAHTEAGGEKALALYRDNVLYQAWLDLSEKDRELLSVIASISVYEPVTIADIRHRWGKDSNYVTMYRSRLLAQGLLTAPARGTVAFALPGLGEYVATRTA